MFIMNRAHLCLHFSDIPFSAALFHVFSHSERASPLRWPLWVLTHPDLRDTPRVRTFMAFAAARIRRMRPLFEGGGQA